MGYLSENCAFAPLTEQLHDSLTGFDCQREPAIQEFYARNHFWPVFKTEEDERMANELE